MTEPARQWSPRFWNGADAFAWLRLLAANRFAVEPAYLYIAAIVTAKSFLNTGLRWVQEGMHAEALKRPPEPPVVVLGHWRTGTTLLHELLTLDDRFLTPTTLHCFEPCQHLLTGEFYRRRLNFLLPSKRPMDNMAAGWDRPQEDEFALCLLGQPSTYTDLAFPNRPPLDPGALDLSSLSPAKKRAWVRAVRRFAAGVAVRDRRPLVLKSPPHTARIPELLEAFPAARFVHIRRDPYTLYASTVKLWQSLAKAHGFQTPRNGPAVEEKVFREFRVIYERYFATRDLIPVGRLVEVRYEDLVQNLVGGTEAVYAGLGLGGFDAVRPKLEAYAAKSKGYETNKFTLTDAQRATIREEWGDLIERLGYS
jgi:hypothetical protein